MLARPDAAALARQPTPAPSSQAFPAAGKPGAVEAPAAGSVRNHHGAHLAVVEAPVHLLLYAQGALVPEGAQRQEDEAAVRHHSNPALWPAHAHNPPSRPFLKRGPTGGLSCELQHTATET